MSFGRKAAVVPCNSARLTAASHRNLDEMQASGALQGRMGQLMASTKAGRCSPMNRNLRGESPWRGGK